MSMTDSHGWEVLDMNKITVYLADIKNTILDTEKRMNDKFEILTNRIDTIENNLKISNTSINRIHNTIKNNYEQYERNKMLYMEILERLSITNDKVKPLLDKLNKNSKDLEKRLSNPFVHSSRVYNRFWRSSIVPNRIDNSISPSLLTDIKEICENDEVEIEGIPNEIEDLTFDRVFL